MLSVDQTTQIVKKFLPDGKIQAVIQYNGLHIFQVFTTDDFEEQWDPFYSVNPITSEFRDFSVITDGDTSEIMSLFIAAKGGV
jgi:hypothetical protein